MQITLSRESVASPDAQRLLRRLDDYLNNLYPPEDNFLELDAEDVDGVHGSFVVARQGGAAIACGAVRRIANATAEIKRMFVVPERRGMGVAKLLLADLETWARSAGVGRLVLETGPLQPEALAFYERAGFAQIPCFGPYADAPQSRCYEKRL